MVFKSVKKSECWKTDKGVCCDFDTRAIRRSSSNLDTVIEHVPHKVVVHIIATTEV